MTEHDSTESARSRWITRISIALAVVAALVVLMTIGSMVTVYVVTEDYEDWLVAVQQGDTFAVCCFLLRGADVNVREETQVRNTPLHIAALEGHRKVAVLLIAKGADVNMKNRCGEAPLHGAAARGHREVVELLIAKGADVSAKGSGATPLELALMDDYEEIAELLRKHGAKESNEDD